MASARQDACAARGRCTGDAVTRIASKGTPPWVAVLAQRRSMRSRQHRVYSLACGHSAAVVRTGSYPMPRHYKCKTCPLSAGHPGGKRSHHKRRP